MDFKDRAKEIFANHSAHDKVHFTSDGQPFFKEHDAWNHSQSLKDKTISRVEKHALGEQTTNHDDKAAAIEKQQAKVDTFKGAYEKALEVANGKKADLDKASAAAGAEGADDKAKKAADEAEKAHVAAVDKSNEALTRLQAAEAELAKLQAQ